MNAWFGWLKEITFKYPDYFGLMSLWYLVVAGVSLAIFVKWLRQPKRAHDSRIKIFGRDTPWIVVVLLAGVIIVALAGPQQAGLKVVQSGGALDIIFVADRSASMLINDINPSRHEVMIHEISSFVHSSAIHPEDRLTLFTFGEKANWKMPLSDDRNEFYEKISDMEHSKDKIYYDTSQLYTYFKPILTLIPEDLDKQDRFFRNGPFSKNTSWVAYPRIVFLFSDGDGNDTSLAEPLLVLAKKSIRVYTIGIGTTKEVAIKIQAPTMSDPKKLEALVIRSKLNMKTLELIKDKTGGKSYVIGSSPNQVQGFLSSAVLENRRPSLTLVASGNSKNFWWHLLYPVALASVLLIMFKL